MFKDFYYSWQYLYALTNDTDVLFFKDKNDNYMFGAIRDDGSQVVTMINSWDHLLGAVVNGDSV